MDKMEEKNDALAAFMLWQQNGGLLPQRGHGRTKLANIMCAYLLRVDAETEPDDVATSSAFLKLRVTPWSSSWRTPT
jgi:hypothetical protein